MGIPDVTTFEVGVSYEISNNSGRSAPLPERILSRGQGTITISRGTFDLVVVGSVETAQLGNGLWILADTPVK
jgi:hypothetical protein